MRTTNLRIGLLVTVAALATAAHAKMMMPQSVPVARLLTNVSAYVAKHPQDAQGYFTLGRLRALAFARGAEPVQVYRYNGDTPDAEPSLPGFAYDSRTNLQRTVKETHLTTESRQHLLESVRNYQEAARLAPREGVYWLGLGWMLEQGVTYAADLQAPPGSPVGAKRTAAQNLKLWRDLATAAYRHAYMLTIKQDLAVEQVADSEVVSKEAGEGMIRLAVGQPTTAAQQAELKEISTSIQKIKLDRQRIISPIIFSLRDGRSLESLLAPNHNVAFDLTGDGRLATWPWVRPDTGILVWDPDHTGRIASGRQLFGSVTWWMFWRDGYEPLAALDDNHDGRLSGRELDGIAVWCDRNGTGISDPGEVTPAAAAGIVSIAVHSDGLSGGVPWNPRGIERTDGSVVPTYDWMPTSLAQAPRANQMLRP